MPLLGVPLLGFLLVDAVTGAFLRRRRWSAR
jgi:hypothetical protein